MADEILFTQEYKKLNKAQKEAVDSIDGPVMVIAGPGTGKTQILALRIGNILKKTDTSADSILCLTFTNSAVRAMRERLHRYIGGEATKVQVLTFHKFAARIIEQFYPVLDLTTTPRILEEAEAVSICDSILRENDWQHLKPRNDTGRHFTELKSLISLLKRERMSPEEFLTEIEKEINHLQKDPTSLSSRGSSKGQMKKEILNQIESLERTKEIVDFYRLYEEKKKEKNLMDHDDTIQYALDIVQNSEEARAEILEKYLYALIDEHQDSSGVQNELLKAIWQEEEKPNIFAVGDDRQLIYAFGGAKMSHFEEFKTTFGRAKVIFLTENYRSTQNILETADNLLASNFSDQKLLTQLKENHNLKLFECDYPRDEIIASGLEIKEKIKQEKIDLNNCAILVPKNKQVTSAIRVLEDLGLKVAAKQNLSLFETAEFKTLLRVLKICTQSLDSVAWSELILDPILKIPVLEGHQYLYQKKGKDLTLVSVLKEQKNLFEYNSIREWAQKLNEIVIQSNQLDLYGLIQRIGDVFLLKTAQNHEELLRRVEVIRSLLHLTLSFTEKNKESLSDFVVFIERLIEYGQDIPLAVFQNEEGIKVLTLHGSKGLEFDFVWIAHLDEGSLMKGRRRNFKLPETVAEKIEEKDEWAAKRELYVAITRAKRFCQLSFARFSYNGQDQNLAPIVADLEMPENIFEKKSFSQTEEQILQKDPTLYIQAGNKISETTQRKLLETVAQEYAEVNVSVSMLNNFFECPRKWYFRNLLKLPESKSESLKFGNLIHSAIDQILKSGKIPTAIEIKKLVQADKTAEKIIEAWIKERLPKIESKRENEKNISIHLKEMPHLNIYGKIDLVEELDKNNLRVTDFKTGNPRKKNEIEKIDEENRMSDYMRQLAMYSLLLQESKKDKEVKESVLEFLEAKNEKDKFYNTSIKPEQIKSILRDIQDYDHLVKNGLWFDRPCHYNSYGKNAECEYCQMAKFYREN